MSHRHLRLLMALLTVLVSIGISTTKAGAAGAITINNTFVAAFQGVDSVGSQIAVFTDSNASAGISDFTTSINFGDGAIVTNGLISGGSGNYTLNLGSVSHIYSTLGSKQLTVTITDNTTSATSTKVTNVIVFDAPISPAGGTLNFGAVPDTTTLPTSVAFSDLDTTGSAADFTAIIHFGDGTSAPAAAITGTPAAFSIQFPQHSFSRYGALNGDIAITDINGANADKTFTVNVVDQTVLGATSVSAAVAGQPVTFTITATGAAPASGTPTGTVNLSTSSASLGSATLANGQASITTSSLPVGTEPLTLTYSGDAAHLGASVSVASVTVTQDTTTTTLGAYISPVNVGQSTPIAAIVTANAPGIGIPGGSVSFYNGPISPDNLMGTANVVLGTATLMYSYTNVGTQTIVAQYNGDVNFLGSTAANTGTVTVNPAQTSISVASSRGIVGFGQPVTLTANLLVLGQSTAVPTGTVNFYLGDIAPANLLSAVTVNNGQAVLTTSTLPAGADIITAVYVGTTTVAGSSSQPITVTVTPGAAAISIATSANPAVDVTPVVLTATVTNLVNGFGVPTGTVTFFSGTAQIGTANVDGSGVAVLTVSLPVGTSSITATYNGDASRAPATSTAISQAVNYALPILSQLSPSSIVEGSAATHVTVTGSGFSSSSVVRVNGSAVATILVSSTQLTAVIPAARLTAATGSNPLVVTVTNPAPGGGTSAAASLTVADSITVSPNPAITVTSGTQASLVAQFHDVNPASLVGSFTATIDWGDGSAVSAGAITADGGGDFTVNASHIYDASGLTATTTFQPIVTVTGIGGVTASATGAAVIAPPFTTLPAGLSMVGMPYDYSATQLTAADVLGLVPDAAHNNRINLATYDPLNNAYFVYPNLPGTNAVNSALNGEQLIPGQGYWVRAAAATPLTATGGAVPSPFTAQVKAGWNMIADPFTTALPSSAISFAANTTVGGHPANYSLSYQQAVMFGLVTNAIFGYDTTTHAYVIVTTIQPYQGYWIYVNSGVSHNSDVSITYTQPGN